MVVLIKYNQTRAYFQRQRKHEFARHRFVHMEISMSNGLMNLTFAYSNILTASIQDGYLGVAAAMICGTLASCVGTMFIGGLICWHNALCLGTQGASPFVHVRKCRSKWSNKGLERKRSSLLIVCVHGLLECVEPWLSLTLSFFLALSLFLIFLLFFFL